MLDGALTIGSAELDHVTWLTPAQVFAIRLSGIIGGMTGDFKNMEDIAIDFQNQNPMNEEARRNMSIAAKKRNTNSRSFAEFVD